MSPRSKFASLEEATGLGALHALRPLTVLAVKYEDHTSEDGEDTDSGGSDYGNDFDEDEDTEVVAHHHLHSITPKITLEMDWDEEEPPTQNWTPEQMVGAFRPHRIDPD